MTTRITMVPGFEQILDKTIGVQVVLRSRAEAAAAHAKSIAPVETGAYRDGIGVEGTDLVARDFKSHWIEFGTVRTRAQAVLRTAARLFSSRLREA